MKHVRSKTRKGSVYYTDSWRGYRWLKRYGKHLTVSHSKILDGKRTKNHINGIEGFRSYAKHILYHYLCIITVESRNIIFRCT
jgi:transposase